MTDSSGRTPEIYYFVSKLARFIFGVFGWRVTGEIPNFPKMLFIGAPHTSNWDGAVFYLFSLSVRAHIHFLGKHTLFKPPFGGLMRWAGGVPINRTTTVNAVDQVVEAFNAHERMALILAPEGTRSYTDHWKTGFYYIALKAQVPVVFAYLDYQRKLCGVGPHFMPTGDIDADFKLVQDFYKDKVGRHPEKQGPIVLPPKEE
ncbi:MAG: lysophospholipid acyltransferase family protein [Anaerolineae bacterium]|nr:lysophospholipid acyltransferase family protein [Anaerolineae bacterium]